MGSETSSTIVDWEMSEMLKNPQGMKRAQAKVQSVFDKKGNVDETCLHELQYLNSNIKETLRLHPSAPLLVPRESGEQCTINGYDIPAKTKVIVHAWAIGQDPKYWNEAEKFDPERFLHNEIDFKGRDLSSFRLVLEGGYAPGYRSQFLIFSFHLHNCCIILIGNSLMERSMKN